MMQLLKLAHNSWSEDLLKELNSMRSMNQMCDIKLILEGDSAVAHSCVLAAASPFFKTILSGTENLEINLESFPRRIVIYMLDFIYNGILLFPKEDLDLLHSIANILNIPSLLDLTQEMLKHCTASDLQDAKLKPNLEQPSSELSHDDANKQTLVQHPQTSDELVIEEQFSGQVHPAHSLSNLPVSLNLVDVVESLDALDRAGGEDGTQSCSDPGNTQIFVKDEMHTTEDSQSTVTELNQEKHLAAEDKQVEHVGVIKDELIEFNTSRRLKSFVPSALIMIQDKVVPGDGSVSNRAMETLPDGLSIGTSQINESEDGIYSTQLLPKGALFGPYQGKILHDVKSTEQISKRYLWKIYKNGKLVHWLSGQDESLANWMRYVQYTSNSQQQNLEAFQHSGHLFFRAIKDIPPYSELVVKYGNRQSSVLGTANDQALHSDNNVIGGENDENGSLFRCEMCNILYTSEIVFHKHMHIKHSHSLPLHVYLQTEKDKTTRIDNNEEIPGHDRKIAKNRITAGSVRTRSSFRQLETKETSEQRKCLRKRDIKKLEETTYHCDVCNKIFTSLGNLQKHKLIHSNERPYACPICGRAFVQMSNMKNHVKIHNNEKHHVCSNCGKSFCRPNELRRHERYHSKEMPYICSVCNKGFKTVGNLKRHQTCHTGEKPYKCSVCGRDFNRLENLKTHMRCHTGEKPFQCTLCGNCFSTNAHLRVHMRRHSGEKPYVCSVCTKSFVDLTTLRAHSKIHNKGQCV